MNTKNRQNNPWPARLRRMTPVSSLLTRRMGGAGIALAAIHTAGAAEYEWRGLWESNVNWHERLQWLDLATDEAPAARPNSADAVVYFREGEGFPSIYDIHLGGSGTGPGNNTKQVQGLHFDSATPYTIWLKRTAADTFGILTGAPNYENKRAQLTIHGSVTVAGGGQSHTIIGYKRGDGEPTAALEGGNLRIGSVDFDIGEGSTLKLDARIISSVTTATNPVKSGLGTLILAANSGVGSNPWNLVGGTFQVAEGTLVLAENQASGHLSNKYTVADGATMEFAGTGTPYNSISGDLTLNGAGVGGIGALYASTTSTLNKVRGTTTGTAVVVLASSSTIGVKEGKTLTITKTITGGGSAVLTKNGAGTLDLTGVNTYSGGTTVSAGALLANNTTGSATGTGAVTVDGGTASIGGSGTIGALNVTTGTVAPGNSTGTLTTGDFSLGAGGFYELEILDIDHYDQIVANGDVSLGGTLSLVPGIWDLENGDLLFILLNDGDDAVDGTFIGLLEGATFSSGGYDFRITYTANFDDTLPSFTGGNDVALMVIPEPSLPLFAGVGAMCFWTIRRRRK